MAKYGDEYGHVQNQEFDNRAVHEQTGAKIGVGTEATAMNGIRSGEQPQQQQQPQLEKLPRSGSLSSSSSEDEGEGGLRKKKGLTDKIMEKIPGVGHKEQQCGHDTTTTTTTTAPATTTMPGGEVVHSEEKKGVMDKIKEKLPGHN